MGSLLNAAKGQAVLALNHSVLVFARISSRSVVAMRAEGDQSDPKVRAVDPVLRFITAGRELALDEPRGRFLNLEFS